jgi:Uma2 family endonuclease
MSTTIRAPRKALLTCDDYRAEGEVMARYDIVDGVREFTTQPTRRHQKYLLNLAELLRAYQRATRAGEVLLAPTDILIRRAPLRARQPDLSLMSPARLAACAPPDDPAPSLVAPELVVEILSPSEHSRLRAAKLADYRQVGVLECWVVGPDTQTVQPLRLTPDPAESIATAGVGETARSFAFPGLEVPVDAIFAD